LSILWRSQIMWCSLQMKIGSIVVRRTAIDVSLLRSFAMIASPMLSAFSIAEFLPMGPDPRRLGTFTHGCSVWNGRKPGAVIWERFGG
jgi:hypothetical protein